MPVLPVRTVIKHYVPYHFNVRVARCVQLSLTLTHKGNTDNGRCVLGRYLYRFGRDYQIKQSHLHIALCVLLCLPTTQNINAKCFQLTIVLYFILQWNK